MVGSDKEVENNGRKVRGRKYPWGVIEVDNEEHCDFIKLRQMLIRTHMEELKEYTNEVLYESYRTQKLASGVIQTNENNIKYVLFGVGVCNLTDPPSPTSPLSKFEEERIAHDLKMQKMESEMKAVFHQKVAEKESKLKVSEDEVKHTKFIVHLFLQGFSKQLCNAFSLSQNT